jgi:hypothetical protein
MWIQRQRAVEYTVVDVRTAVISLMNWKFGVNFRKY